MDTKTSQILGINGFGRIGKLCLWHHLGRRYFKEIVINTGRMVGEGLEDLVHYIEALSVKHEVTLIAFVRTGQFEAIEHLQNVCKQVVAVPYDPDSLLQRLWRAGWRVLLPRVYGRNVSIRFAAALRGLVSENQFHVSREKNVLPAY